MDCPISRREFATVATAVAFGLPVFEAECRARATESPAVTAGGFASQPVRPYHLMCVVCRLGEGRTEDLGDARLTSLIKAVRQDPKALERNKLPFLICRERPLWRSLTRENGLIAAFGTPQRAFPTGIKS